MRAGARTWDFIDMIKWVVACQGGPQSDTALCSSTRGILSGQNLPQRAPTTQSLPNNMQKYDACMRHGNMSVLG